MLNENLGKKIGKESQAVTTGLWLLMIVALILPATLHASQAIPAREPQAGEISGTAFRDYNANGLHDTTASTSGAFDEPGLPNAVVTAYDTTGAPAGSTTSIADGSYSLDVPAGASYRVEFTLPTDGSMAYLHPGAAGPTTVQFVSVPIDGTLSNVNAGFNNPADYCQAEPPLITAKTSVGSRTYMPLPPNDPHGLNESLIGLPYTASGNLSDPTDHTTHARLDQTGTLFGLAYARQAGIILAGAYWKMYADVGPVADPLGAIYAIDPAGGDPSLYANLNGIINPGDGSPLPNDVAGIDARRTGDVDYDSWYPDGECGQALPPSGGFFGCWRHDPVGWDLVGKQGLGDLEIDDEETTIFAINLKDKQLYQLPVETAGWPVAELAAPPIPVPNTCAAAADAIPGGLGFKDGLLYVGVTCTAESTQIESELSSEVWTFDPASQTFSAGPVFQLSLNYPRGCLWADNPSANAPKNAATGQNCQPYWDGTAMDYDNAHWNPWPQTWEEHYMGNAGRNAPGKPDWKYDGSGQSSPDGVQDLVQVETPHPWLSDIGFDDDNMLLALRDINGDRTGDRNFSFAPNANLAYPNVTGPPSDPWEIIDITTEAYEINGVGHGDLLRACADGGGGWMLEDNGNCGGITTHGVDNGQGPGPGNAIPDDGSSGWGEWYWDDSGPGNRNPSPDLIDTQTVVTGVGGYYWGNEQVVTGGLFQRQGDPHLAVTANAQLQKNDGGLLRLSNVESHPDLPPAGGFVDLPYPDAITTHAGLTVNRTQLYPPVVFVPGGILHTFFGQANGLGDVEALCDTAPMEIGNRLWCDGGFDGNGGPDGIQDPGEPSPGAGIEVSLTCGADSALTTTDANGEYLFTDQMWDAQVNPGTDGDLIPRNTPCEIRVDLSQETLRCGNTLSTTDVEGDASNDATFDIRDSDASEVVIGIETFAEIVFDTGGPGGNNHGLDMGFAVEGIDWGDAPELPPNPLDGFPTLAVNDGARHGLNQHSGGPFLGHCVDGESDGLASLDADGDDNNVGTISIGTCDPPGDDEDGVEFTEDLVPGQDGRVVVNTVSNPVDCFLNAWIDFNANGSWDDPGEQFADDVVLSGNDILGLDISVPSDAVIGTTYARFRCSTLPGLDPYGPAPDGEVEDYRVVTVPLAVTLADFQATAAGDHIQVAWTTVSEVDNIGFNLYRSRSASQPGILLAFVPSIRPGGSSGASYAYQDADVTARQTYWYWLEDVDANGATSLHGPVSATLQAPTVVTLDELAATEQAGGNLSWLLVAGSTMLALLAARFARRARIGM
ncbi:MAG: GEVED domain-containing protein [Chloroflexota bacterium]|nr:GEVED domain-containing protein [Chloroflexota bacterium]